MESSTQPRCRQNSRGHRELDDVVIPWKTVTRRACRARRRDISWSVEWVILDPKVGSRWERRTGTGWAASAKVTSVTLVSTGRHAVPSYSGVDFPCGEIHRLPFGRFPAPRNGIAKRATNLMARWGNQGGSSSLGMFRRLRALCDGLPAGARVFETART